VTSSRRRAWLAFLVTCLATLAVASLVWAMREGWPGTATSGYSTATPTPPVATAGPVDAAAEPAAAGEATPVQLVAPAVGVRMPVVAKGVAADGQMALPADPRRVGWYRFGPSPTAERGSTVLAGHVDSKRYGVGPLSRLRGIAKGDVIRIATSDGRMIRFRTTSVRSIDKDELPLDAVFDRAGPPRLRIVTCGGEYDRRYGGYQDNVVVTAVPWR
jgi:hypothetical protein